MFKKHMVYCCFLPCQNVVNYIQKSLSEKNVKIATPFTWGKWPDSCFTVFVQEKVHKRQRFTVNPLLGKRKTSRFTVNAFPAELKT